MIRAAHSDPSDGGRGLLSMTWSDILFAHWPVEPATVEERLPDGYEVDTHEGRAYLGVVPFVMSDIGPSVVPLSRSFGELNLRTYVRGPDGGRGVYFFNLDADDRLSVLVARSLFRLPYYRAEMEVSSRADGVTFRSTRTHPGVEPAGFVARYGPDGEFAVADPGSLAAFLTERYRFYTVDEAGRTYYGDIDHEPWRLAPAWAEFERNDLFRAAGFARPPGDPICHYAREVEVSAGRVHRTGP